MSTQGRLVAIAQRQQKIDELEAQKHNIEVELHELLKLKQQHPGASVEFAGNRDSQFVELEGSFDKEALQELLEAFDLPLEIRSRLHT